MDAWAQILITVIGVLGSGAIWQYLGTRLKLKTFERKEKLQNNDGVQYRDELRNKVLLLTQEVSALRVKVEFLEKENDRLKG
jgi:hypothetical protein